MAVYGLNKSPYRSQYRKDIDTRAIVGGAPLATPSGGYALNTTNFPSLLEAFLLTSISGNNLVGVNNVLTITSSTGWTIPPTTPTGEFRRTSGGTVTLSGTLAIGTKSIALIVIGTNISGRPISIGDTTNGPCINIIENGAANSLYNSTNFATPPDLTGLCTKGMAHVLNMESANGTGKLYGYNGSVISSGNDVITGDISQNWPAFTTGSGFAAVIVAAGVSMSGIFLLGFNTYPSDIDFGNALIWMSANPTKLYPGFYKRS